MTDYDNEVTASITGNRPDPNISLSVARLVPVNFYFTSRLYKDTSDVSSKPSDKHDAVN